MSHESNPTYLAGNGQVVTTPTTADLDNCGRLELFDAEGMRIPAIDIPDCTYFPYPEFPRPDEGSLTVENAALRNLVNRAKEAIWAANCDFDEDNEIPPRTNHALARLDEALTHFESLAACPDPDPVLTHAMREGWPKRLPYHVARDNGRF